RTALAWHRILRRQQGGRHGHLCTCSRRVAYGDGTRTSGGRHQGRRSPDVHADDQRQSSRRLEDHRVGRGDPINRRLPHRERSQNIVLVGHSYGGMIITGVADRVQDRIRRLVYWNAFVPNNGESVLDMVPRPFAAMFEAIAAERGDGSVTLPFPIWREAFINDADLDTAQRAYRALNPHSLKTLADKIALKVNPAE